MKYTQKIHNWYPYAYGGYSISYLINATANPSFYEITEIFDQDGNFEDRITNPDIGRSLDLTHIRSQLNHNLLFGLGVKYRLQYQYISFDVRYALGLNNRLNIKNQFDLGTGGQPNGNDIRELIFRYGQVDNDFRLDNLSISFGYVYPLYRPRKIQKKSAGSFLGDLFKRKSKKGSTGE